MKINKLIDHTILKADAPAQDIKKLCEEALKYDFASVCVNPCWVKMCAEILKGSDVKVCTVIGFPLGANTSEVKVFEAQDALKNGAQELDLVINIGAVKSGDYETVFHDIKLIRNISNDFILKVIFETCLLTNEEKIKVCDLCVCAGADFVKTSTGFSTGGATVEDVKLMREHIKPEMKVKASGGIRDLETLNKMVEAGAERIGTSSGVKIMESL
ncbi:deoxyribose-phosphate aldolase [Elusimicrobium posterum]|uniref:deoxyribose-phosphate aldolase n=1 Tax=Elusimicrobium posterum TaxID=3116653 RepID=UPI003C75B7CD